ncbi:MAG: hypothetical protein WEC99_05840 [Halofilum sp. (in: g-proteobacteria)]
MPRTLIVALAALTLLAGTAVAETARFSTPSESDQVEEADDKAVALHYDSELWSVESRPSKYRMFALMTHEDENVTGMIVYRGEPASEEEVRERVVAELEMFKDHEVDFSRREVNGVPVLYVDAVASKSDGSDVVVNSYYWMGENGVVDYAVMAPSDGFDQHRDAVMDLLNGLEISAERAAN